MRNCRTPWERPRFGPEGQLLALFTRMEMLLFCVWALLALNPGPGATEEIFEVSIWPDQALVKLGQSLMINCSTTCPDPGPGGIETYLKKTQVDKGPQWKEFLLEDVTENSVLQCFFSCAGIQKDTSLDITVYQPPEQVILELQPAWVAMDEAFTVKCHVPSVAPLENLTLTLLQGNQELHRKDFMNLAVASQRAEITINVKAQREDDRCNFSCCAELDLSSHGGGLFHSSSAIKVLRIFEFSESPQIWVSSLLEIGMAEAVSCELARVFPAREVMFHMFLGDQELSLFVSWKGDTAWANATVRAMETGDQELSCLVSLGPMEQKTREPVHVYNKPRLEESDCPGYQTWVKGTEQLLACVPKGNPTPTLVCTWNGVIFNFEVPRKATQNHTGTYCCTASNQLGSVSKDIAVIVRGLDEGISSAIFVIIIVALGVGVITIALYLNYRPCKIERRKLPYRQKEKNKEEESQFAVQQAEKCNAHNC
ncbi:intercellular adhesion molecule 1 isoform X3 [Acinonyx jubatus]|uniref:Intercellular adhesion molecule 1 isoform X3 n=1 Tax=Acinonyx jubatus TaxID=32536 RepID=A0ABM3P993_ACIJB|nr:intercellular adhesion molecule 1 isoform X3 [Acinonyx jubatus]